jgi:predicted MFS family arabinose efflux permease
MLVGGAAATLLSWRAGFWLNVPIGIAMIVLAPRFLPESPVSPGRFDVAGAFTSTFGIGALVFGLLHSSEEGWSSPVTLVAFVAALVLLAVFIVAEARAAQPIMPLRLFASRVRTGSYVVRLTYMGAMIGFFFFSTQFLQGVLGFSPLQAGLAFLPMTLVNFAVALAIPRLVARVGGRWPRVVGIALTLGGMLWLSRLAPDSAYVAGVALPMLLIGAGQGLAFAPMTSFGIAGATAADAGAASGVVNTFHQVGMSLGLGILVAVAAASEPATGPADVALAVEVSSALTGSGILLAASLVLACVLVAPGTRRIPIARGSDSPSLVSATTRTLEA